MLNCWSYDHTHNLNYELFIENKKKRLFLTTQKLGTGITILLLIKHKKLLKIKQIKIKRSFDCAHAYMIYVLLLLVLLYFNKNLFS